MNDSERDRLIARIDANVEALVKCQGDHEVRLRELEVAHQRRKGATSILVGAVSAAWALALVIIGAIWSKS